MTRQNRTSRPECAPITLIDYEQAERAIAHDGARGGMIAHGIVTVVVSAFLLVINFTLADELAVTAVQWAALASEN